MILKKWKHCSHDLLLIDLQDSEFSPGLAKHDENGVG
jgi:hypothetical protein